MPARWSLIGGTSCQHSNYSFEISAIEKVIHYLYKAGVTTDKAIPQQLMGLPVLLTDGVPYRAALHKDDRLLTVAPIWRGG